MCPYNREGCICSSDVWIRGVHLCIVCCSTSEDSFEDDVQFTFQTDLVIECEARNDGWQAILLSRPLLLCLL